MTDTEINAAIAKACGWVDIQPCTCTGHSRGRVEAGYDLQHIPDYTSDQREINRACKIKFTERIQKDLFCFELRHAVEKLAAEQGAHGMEFDVACAPARLRAECFLRTIGEWKE